MSLQKLYEHRELWARKPLLHVVYGVWFDALLEAQPAGGRVLELGAGPGLLSTYARQKRPDLRWTATDILAAPWNDVAADALRLPFADGIFDGMVGLDVLHHLARPAAFFSEAARVLSPDGRLTMVEPWVTPLSYPIYRWLHPEGCHLGLDPWNPFASEVGGAKDAFDGDGAVVWKLIRSTPPERWAELGLAAPSTTRLNGFAYLASLGFRPASLVPRGAGPALVAVDRALQPLAGLLGMRVLASWARAQPVNATA